MKRLLLSLMILASFHAAAQEHSFIIDDGALKWQKVFAEENIFPENAVHNLLVDGHFRDIEQNDNLITCELRQLRLNYKGAGYNRISLPIYITNDIFSGFVTIQIKEGRYRVTLERIHCYNTHYGDGLLDDLTVNKKGEFKSDFPESPAAFVLEYNFNALFSNLGKQIDDEW